MKKSLITFFLITLLCLTGDLVSISNVNFNQYEGFVLNDEEPDPWDKTGI